MKKRRLKAIRILVLVFTLVLCVGILQSQAVTLQQPITPTLQQPIAASNVPTLSTFKINGDAATTPTQSVSLNNQALVLKGSGPVTHYRASERADFAGAVWTTYSAAPAFTLSAGVGVKTVYLQVKNVTGASNILSDSITYQLPPPQVTSFKINAGATTTATQSVTLSNVATGPPTAYRVSESPTAITSAPWVSSYTASMPFSLSATEGAKTLYYQVKNANGESNVMSASITHQKRQLYTIKGGDFYNVGKDYGYNSFGNKLDDSSICDDIGANMNPGMNRAQATIRFGIVTGSKCTFSFFGVQKLKNGFVFKTFTGKADWLGDGRKGDIYLTSTPQSGSDSILFTLSGWCDNGSYPYYSISDITLEGPAGMDWKKALIP